MDSTEPFRLPAEVAASTDLTHLWSQQVAVPPPTWSDDPVYDRLLQRLGRTLHRDQHQHVVLTAESGIDVEALITEFAQRSLSDWLPFLRRRRIVFIDARFTIPDAARDRLSAIIATVAPHESLIVCLAGLGSLLRTPNGTNRDYLLSILASADCQIIGLMTPTEYEELLGGDAELEERFARLDVPEPSLETAIRILRIYAGALRQRYRLELNDDTIKLAATLSSNYVLHERLPGKARRILQLICQDKEFERTQLGRDVTDVGNDDVVQTVSEMTGVPAETLRGIAARQDYLESLREFVVGQDHALQEVATELGLIKAGFTDPGKPASVLLLIGQTGTGKTELAKALARFYSHSKRLRTYTLGNMVEPHSVSAIIGVPPGYVGHDRGGKIVHDLQSDPNCVFLLDEADKAHPDVLQPFLNLFDEGWIRDQRGVQAYANKAIFVLTTNVGQRMIADMAKQGKSPAEMATRMKETLAQIKHSKSNRPVFAPEFLARIKRVIVFQPLSRDAMHGIVQKLVRKMTEVWKTQRDKLFEVDEGLLKAVADEAHCHNEKSDGREGGRIVRKIFSAYVEAPLQREISLRPQGYVAAKRVLVRGIPESSIVHDDQAAPAGAKEPAVGLERYQIEVVFDPAEIAVND